ncbi:MAG: hypothetical protein KAT15_01525 [Bacteroidales bacterium]|nr:hypothetical protein [Bacteroidales bacterium]
MGFIFMALLPVACEELTYDAPEDQPVFFEYNYINHAWGYQHHGWLIDGEGYVRYYNLPESYRFPDSTGYLSLEDLEHNIGLTDSVIEQVDGAELEKYRNYIPGAAKGEIGESSNVAADAGTSMLSCYLYDIHEDAYRKVFLAQSGDWEQFNLSEDAEKLVDWLREFDVFWLSE